MTNNNRSRFSINDLYSSDVNEIGKLLLSVINNYVKIEEIDESIAYERALSDYSFWYSDSEEKRIQLENIVKSLLQNQRDN